VGWGGVGWGGVGWGGMGWGGVGWGGVGWGAVGGGFRRRAHAAKGTTDGCEQKAACGLAPTKNVYARPRANEHTLGTAAITPRTQRTQAPGACTHARHTASSGDRPHRQPLPHLVSELGGVRGFYHRARVAGVGSPRPPPTPRGRRGRGPRPRRGARGPHARTCAKHRARHASSARGGYTSLPPATLLAAGFGRARRRKRERRHGATRKAAGLGLAPRAPPPPLLSPSLHSPPSPARRTRVCTHAA
jgi:hypothetical protein